MVDIRSVVHSVTDTETSCLLANLVSSLLVFTDTHSESTVHLHVR